MPFSLRIKSPSGTEGSPPPSRSLDSAPIEASARSPAARAGSGVARRSPRVDGGSDKMAARSKSWGGDSNWKRLTFKVSQPRGRRSRRPIRTPRTPGSASRVGAPPSCRRLDLQSVLRVSLERRRSRALEPLALAPRQSNHLRTALPLRGALHLHSRRYGGRARFTGDTFQGHGSLRFPPRRPKGLRCAS
ncbi:hypothetical protein HPB47_000903 [Ixodes persulcatus]|uniref:Uncharacterized protein n=1 Tax=Ixodes persulcatus TaxID=34615 RepID=A0AC60PQQ6_IXOPE|nr:hypothetical protein HPB47_000903 [Ixodes persulcatus]